jgi:hypothetical protein
MKSCRRRMLQLLAATLASAVPAAALADEG